MIRIISRESANMALRPQLFITLGSSTTKLESKETIIGITAQLSVTVETIRDNLEEFALGKRTTSSIYHPSIYLPSTSTHPPKRRNIF